MGYGQCCCPEKILIYCVSQFGGAFIWEDVGINVGDYNNVNKVVAVFVRIH